MGDLIIAGQTFNVMAPVVNWRSTGWDATIERCVPITPGGRTQCGDGIHPYGPKAKNRAPRRFSLRSPLRKYGMNPPLAAVQSVIRMFVVHFDGMYSSAGCWDVLHNERGLSCHFLIDNDGTIYQTLDLALCGFHASEFNQISIGVEMCNRGDAKKWPDYYNDKRKFPEKREPVPCRIHGYKVLGWSMTDPQIRSLQQLAKDLVKLLPNLPLEYPQSSPGQQSWELLSNPFSFSGYVGHYHLTTRKWDPGPFDFKQFVEKLRGTLCFPLWSGKPVANAKSPEIPDSRDELDRIVNQLYALNEQDSDGGFFPVGPWGDLRLWHGGVHVPAPADGPKDPPVFAAFPGRIMAARMGAETSIGSQNFVLLRHDMAIGQSSMRFFSLYMHLKDELRDKAPAPPWMTKPEWQKELPRARNGEVVPLDIPVEAGEVIGRMGEVGPKVGNDDLYKAQVHLEFFSADELFTEFEQRKWVVVDGTSGGRFSDSPEINAMIDGDKDGQLTRAEIVKFFEDSGNAEGLRYVVPFSVSEWTFEPSWKDALKLEPDLLATLKPEQIDRMVDEQIAPGLWWNEEIAKHVGLPVDGVVYHYHPVTFVKYVNDLILETADDPSKQVAPVSADETEEVKGMTVDLEADADDSDMISEEDDGKDDAMIDLPHLIEGYAGEPKDVP